MKYYYLFLFGSLCASLFSFSCSADANLPEQTNALNSSTTLATSTEITAVDLVGTWKIQTMVSDVAVDFNQDGDFNTNILTESDCFNNMYFTFEANGNVLTTQARLYFDVQGNFSCSEKSYTATYEVNQNELKVNFVVNGVSYTEVKSISMTSDGTNDYLNVSLTSFETDSAVYVTEDDGDNVASKIEKIDFSYIRNN